MKKYIEYTVLILIALFACVFCYKCGSRGFLPLDQSIVYDGAWRIIQGQVPFKDFILPIGPITFLYQAGIFCLLGVNYSSYLIGAAFFNFLASILTFLIIKIYIKKSLILPLAGALISSIWFYSQMGTTYPDQTSMFFCLLSLFCLLYTESGTDPKKKVIMLFSSGFIWGIAFLSKQNFAGIFLPLLFLVPFFMNDLNSGKSNTKDFRFHLSGGSKTGKIFWISIGIIFCFLIFLIWLLIFSDINLFIQYFFTIPIEEGVNRFQKISINAKHRFNLIIVILNAVFAIFAIYYIGLFMLKRKSGTKEQSEEDDPPNKPLMALLVLFLICYSFIMIKTTNNNSINAWSFLGVITGLGFSLIHSFLYKINTKLAKTVIPIAIISFAALFYSGIKSAWTRKVHDFNETMIYKHLEFPPTLQALQWGDFTLAGNVGGRRLAIRDFEVVKLIKYLVVTDADFFIFSNFTALYGITGKPSPQPLLWFHKGLTYPRKYDRELDTWIVDSLKKNNIDTIIFEEAGWLGSYMVLNDFPLLNQYINNNFSKKGHIGIYNVYRKKIDAGKNKPKEFIQTF